MKRENQDFLEKSIDNQDITDYNRVNQEFLELRRKEVRFLALSDTVRSIVEKRGIKQNWVVEKMNKVDPGINMNPAKFSAIVCGIRKMTGDELLAFCKATGTNPDCFCSDSTEADYLLGVDGQTQRN